MALLKWFENIAKGAAAIILIVLGLLYTYQDNLLYHPAPPGFPRTVAENPPGYQSPSEWSKNGNRRRKDSASEDAIPFEDYYVTTDDGKKIHVWLLLQENSENVPTLIYFHGNAGNMGLRLKNAALMYALCNINIIMMDYRGYGSSEGTPTEKGLMLDSLAVLDFAKSHPKLKNSPLVAFGRSLGGAVAIQLSKSKPSILRGIIVENTFLSISAMVDTLLPLVSFFKDIVLRIGWDSGTSIQTVALPIMFISGLADELVPPAHMQRLHDLAIMSPHRDFFKVEGGTHNDTFDVAGVTYYERLKAFFDRLRGDDFVHSCLAIGRDLPKEDNIVLPTMGANFAVR